MRAGFFCVLLAGVVGAEDKDAVREAMHLTRVIKAGWAKTDHKAWLDDDAHNALVKSPLQAREVASLAAKVVREQAGGESTGENDSWTALSGFLDKLASACLKAHPQSADAHRAAAEAGLLRARLAEVRGRKVDRKEWEAAIDHLVKEHAIEPAEGEPLLLAAKILTGEFRDAELLRRVCEIGRAAYPKKTIFQVPALLARLDAVKDAKGIKPLLDEWRPLAETYDDHLLGVYNEAITVALRKGWKPGKKHVYLTRRIFRATQELEWEIPYGRWKWDRDKTLTQFGRDGRVRRTIQLSKTYSRYDAKLVKSIAEARQKEYSGKFTDKPKKRRLNAHFKKAYGFAMGGHDEVGDFFHYRCWILRSQSGYLTMIEIWQPTSEPDPEIEFILSTLKPLSVNRR